MSYKIREAKYEDAERIAKIHLQSWKETYAGIISDDYIQKRKLDERIERWKEKLKEKEKINWNLVVETDAGEIVGFLSGGKTRREIGDYKGELYAIYILREYQGKNLGYLLTKRLCSLFLDNGISNMIVLVLEDNPSKNFYIKYGARFLKKISIKIGEQDLIEEIYGWDDFNLFLK